MGVNFVKLYKEYEDYYYEYITQKGNQPSTIKNFRNFWKKGFIKSFDIELESPKDFFLYYNKNKKKYKLYENDRTVKSLKSFMTFLVEKDLIEEEKLKKFQEKLQVKSETKKRENPHDDTNLIYTLQKLKEYNENIYMSYYILYLSGIRGESLIRWFETFDKSKIKFHEKYKTAIYKDEKLSTGKKLCDRIFLPIEVMKFVVKNINKLKKITLNQIQDQIKKEKGKRVQIVFLRKFNATHMLRDKLLTYTSVMYIQSRSLKKDTLSFHYNEGLEENAIKEYWEFLQKYYYKSDLIFLSDWDNLNITQKIEMFSSLYLYFKKIIDYNKYNFNNKPLLQKIDLLFEREELDFELQKELETEINLVEIVYNFILNIDKNRSKEIYKEIQYIIKKQIQLKEELEELNKNIEKNIIIKDNKTEYKPESLPKIINYLNLKQKYEIEIELYNELVIFYNTIHFNFKKYPNKKEENFEVIMDQFELQYYNIKIKKYETNKIANEIIDKSKSEFN